jgi:F-type H+-transporting ATPase subunit gamma
MSSTIISLRRKIDSAGNPQSVVRTMKALAASSISQYEQSVRALGDYYRTVELGLGVCFRGRGSASPMVEDTSTTKTGAIGAVVFGSDQGLVGQFNDKVADHALKVLASLTEKLLIWAVGERVHARLHDTGVPLTGLLGVPHSVKAITPLVGQSRLAAMQRADKNIDDLLEGLNGTYHRLRQSGIDEELFDVISGFEALATRASRPN